MSRFIIGTSDMHRDDACCIYKRDSNVGISHRGICKGEKIRI